MKKLGLVIFVIIVGTSTLHAQLPARSLTTVAAVETGAAVTDMPADSVRLLVGRSAVVTLDKPIARVSLTSSDVADALVTSPSQLLVNGKTPGTISMFVWDRSGSIRRFEVVVQRDLDRLAEQIKEIFPNEQIEVRATGKKIALAGSVSSKEVVEKVTNLAAGFVENKDEVVSLLQLAQGAPSNQVLLKVRFAEVSRSALTQLAFTGAANGYKDGRFFGRTTTQQFPAPEWDKDGKFVFSDFLNLFLFDTKNELAAVVKALQSKGLFQSLAEPNLVSESGKEASFLAGGEFPVPVAQGSSNGTSITVQYKEFGIRLNFTPVVNGQRVNLKVRPEVSSLDFANAVTLNGFRIPALQTRRTETELELQNGQTFAIAGLLNNSMTKTLQKIPGIGDIPVLGLLFQSKSAQKDQTELVVMITPEILPLNSPGVTPNLPKLQEPYLAPLPQNKTIEPPPPAFSPNTRNGEVIEPTATTATTKKADSKKGNASDAAAALSSLSPGKRGETIHLDHNGAPIEAPSAETPLKANGEVVADSAAPAGAAAEAPAAARPMTAAEKKAAAKAEKAERERTEADLRAQAAEAKRQAKQAEEDRRKQKIEEEQRAKEEREQEARNQALARRAAEEARKQEELDKKQQKVIEEAQAKVKAAEAQYQAALAKKQAQ